MRWLRLNGTLISARGLERLKDLAHLERLDLEGCKRVGDDAAPVLASFHSLRAVDLTGTSFTEKGVAALRHAKPDCKIVTGRVPGNEPKAEEPEP
jgi:hypothetical protein